MKLFDFHCEKCRVISERITDGSKELCVICGDEMQKVFSSTVYDRGYERRRYPYHDECLNKDIQSSQHKKKVLKEMNLVQIDGHFARGGVKKEKQGVIYSIPGRKS